MNQELWHAFDRIKAGLDKQERMRSSPAFGEWCVKALPQFSTYLDFVDKADDILGIGVTHCEWLDWLDDRRLAFRGVLRWKIPTAGPLSFYPPTMDQVMRKAAEVTEALGLRDALTRLVRSREAPTSETSGASGERGSKKSRPKKSKPGTRS